ncbi:adhesion G-protein coupled receptor G4 [Betta splendens]|uniref:Adhesion G-protein coupled receptor G4 n=1 Tax=Betta splendens TaxID=158456 RepID=A0A9W2Y2Q1_BETSP|nr:adhesion G-protein coupled receptor G4 [Betta splendens]
MSSGQKAVHAAVMSPIRSQSSLGICIQLLLCFLAASATDSLWGRKLVLSGRPCLWQLRPDVVPALEELTACILLRPFVLTQWTGFAYKAPGAAGTELGLGGSGAQVSAWLFGEERRFARRLAEGAWHSVCLAWSGRAQRARLYVNGSLQGEVRGNRARPRRLAPNGTLTLGASHYVDADGGVREEAGSNLLGEVGRFGLWGRERGEGELGAHSCADGDVVSWDLRQWRPGCPPRDDGSLTCAWSHYKIKVRTFVVHSAQSGNCSLPLEGVMRNWLESVLPPNASVHEVSVSSPSSACRALGDSAAPRLQHPQESGASTNCDACLSSEVYVTVEPSADVGGVQTSVAALLTVPFSSDALSVTAEPRSLSITPVESFPTIRDPPTPGSTESCPTQSLSAQPMSASTTRDPLDLNQTDAVAPDVFFRANVSLSVTGNPENPRDVIEKWAKKALEVNGTMTVLNLVVKENVGRNLQEHEMTWTFDQQKHQYNCTFHVQEQKKSSVEEVRAAITAALSSKYEDGSASIQPTDLAVRHIEPGNCLEDAASSVYGMYIWPETFPQVKQEMGCNEPPSERAFRLCKLDIDTDASSWAKPDMTNCQPLVSISDLNNITVTTGNTAEVVDLIQDLVGAQLGNGAELSSSDLTSVVDKLGEVIDVSVGPDTGANIVSIISNILLSETNVTPVASAVLNMTNKMGDTMDFQSESVSLTAPSMALSMVNVDPVGFGGLTFGVTSSSQLGPSTFVNQSFVSDPLQETVATIALPPTLHSFFPPGETDTTRVQFQFYETHDLFQDPDTTDSTQGNWTLNSYIISASINNSIVRDLTDPVVVTLRHQRPIQPGDKVQCRFWDFQRNGGRGGWNRRGCRTRGVSSDRTSCVCDHLTHFAVLLDVSRSPLSGADALALALLSYAGCGLSSVFLGLTLLTYVVFAKLRRDYPSRILVNLSAALLGLDLLFLLDAWLASFSNRHACVAAAAALHYFLLASFTWMGLEAVHMYFALVKVFNVYVPAYVLKFCAAGWGVPLVIVSLVLAIDTDAYGSSTPEEAAVALQSSDSFCWLQSDVFFYATVVAFILLVLLFNTCVFVVVLVQIRQMKANKPSANGTSSSLKELRAVASLTVLLGLTWSVGLFSFGPGRVVLMYVFTICNSLQGFFVFLFHCLMKDNVRKQWRIHLCCGRFRPSECSDWSRSVTAANHFKKQNLVNSDSLASDGASAVRKASDSSAVSASQ